MMYVLLILLVILISGGNYLQFFCSSKARIKASVQEIGNQLKRQADLIPNLEDLLRVIWAMKKVFLKC